MNEALTMLIEAVRLERAANKARRETIEQVDMVFGEFMRGKGWTKRQLADALGVDPTFISKLYGGYDGNAPSQKILLRMAVLWADELGVEMPDDLKEDDEVGTPARQKNDLTTHDLKLEHDDDGE